MNNEFDYYLIGRENNSSHPLLKATVNAQYEDEDSYIENPKEMEFSFAKPIPSRPKMVDFHSTPYSVVSDKLAEVIAKMNIDGVQLIPAAVVGKDSVTHLNYYFVHIYTILPALCRDESEYDWDDFIEEANPIEKLVLNKEILRFIPLKKRLVFQLKENCTFQLYHQSVVDAIMATQPEGVSFCHVNDWSMGAPFDSTK